MQRVIFQSAAEVYDLMKPNWKANREFLLAQIIRITEEYLTSGRTVVTPRLFSEDDLRHRVLYTLNMTRIVQHLWEAIRFENAFAVVPVFDKERPIRFTGDMQPWFTRRPCEPTVRSHINLCVLDSRWEASEAFELDRNSNVAAWVKNDHMGFAIIYVHRGIILKYHPWGALGVILASANRGAVGNHYSTHFGLPGREKSGIKNEIGTPFLFPLHFYFSPLSVRADCVVRTIFRPDQL
jgi:type III restriction enzyme